MDADRLAKHRTIDLTTVGAKSGLPRRIEIWWFRFEGRFIITGTPGKRDWLANIRSNSDIIVHVGGEDLRGVAIEVDDPDFRQRFFADGETRWYASQSQLEQLVTAAPMVEIHLEKSKHP